MTLLIRFTLGTLVWGSSFRKSRFCRRVGIKRIWKVLELQMPWDSWREGRQEAS